MFEGLGMSKMELDTVLHEFATAYPQYKSRHEFSLVQFNDFIELLEHRKETIWPHVFEVKFLGASLGILGTLLLSTCNTLQFWQNATNLMLTQLLARIFLIGALAALMKMVLEEIQTKREHLNEILILLNSMN